MANEAALESLFDGAIQFKLSHIFCNMKLDSIKDVEVYRKRVKTRWIFSKKVHIIKLTINEAERVAESLTEDIDIKSIVDDVYDKYDELEIVYV